MQNFVLPVLKVRKLLLEMIRKNLEACQGKKSVRNAWQLVGLVY